MAMETAALSELPLEELLRLEVRSAARRTQPQSEAPAAVTVLTASDFRRHGWRTLAEGLASVRGLYVSDDRSYQYLGVRGISTLGDYNTRVLLLVDGERASDNIFNQSQLGATELLDAALIDRVEFVPGAVAALYGDNAVCGVINVITRGTGTRETGLRLGAASGDAWQASAWQAGGGWLLGASRVLRGGEALRFPEFDTPAQNGGVADALDQDNALRLFAKRETGPWTLHAAFARRDRNPPTAVYGTDFNDPRSAISDQSLQASAQYRDTLDSGGAWSARLSFGDYQFQSHLPIAGVMNRDVAHGQWWGLDGRAEQPGWQGLPLVYGAEYRRDLRQEQRNFDETPFVSYVDDHRHGAHWAAYAQQDVGLGATARLTAGARLDHHDRHGTRLSPRAALVQPLDNGSRLKFSVARAHRLPNVFEQFYGDASVAGATYKANPGLRPEIKDGLEASLETPLGRAADLTLTLFAARVRRNISHTLDPADGLLQFQNGPGMAIQGFEAGYQRALTGGGKLHLDYTFARARSRAGGTAANSPRHLLKGRYSTALPGTETVLGLEAQAMSSLLTRGGRVGGHTQWHVQLTQPLGKGAELGFGVRNLTGHKGRTPVDLEHVPDSIENDSRVWRLDFTLHFD
jgi:iron complex outermembrane receptor protein